MRKAFLSAIEPPLFLEYYVKCGHDLKIQTDWLKRVGIFVKNNTVAFPNTKYKKQID